MAKVNKIRLMRSSPEFRDIINEVRARYIMKGKIPPTIAQITKVIAKRINKEDLIHEVFIRF